MAASPSSPAPNRILTKHSNRGFQIRKTPKITVEQERDLREQLHHEIEAKTKACSNAAYDCSLPRLDGHEFCLKHILQDAKAPYKQCSYQYPRTSKRCQKPAPKRDVYTNFCFEHSRQTQLQLTRNKQGTFRNAETNETLLRDLVHRVDPQRRAQVSSSKYVDAFGASARVLNYASDDSDGADGVAAGAAGAAAMSAADNEDDDVDVLADLGMEAGQLAGLAWTGQDMDESDNESVDSQNEDFLKHAGIYTTEEATVITKSKMIRLQTLYGEQICRLGHLLRLRRRQCLLQLRGDRGEAGHSTTSTEAAALAAAGTKISLSPTAQAAASSAIFKPHKTQTQKALNQYLKKHGVEAVLQHKAAERRAAAATGGAAGGNKLPPAAVRCAFSEGGVKCLERGIPLSKYCRRHILEDRGQVLFKACGVEKSGVVCREPVPITVENATCVLHFELPPQHAYTQKKYESDEEAESAVDDDDEVMGITTTTTTTTIDTGSAMRSQTSKNSSGSSRRRLLSSQSNEGRAEMAEMCIEQSAEAMSPLRVSPMDLEDEAAATID